MTRLQSTLVLWAGMLAGCVGGAAVERFDAVDRQIIVAATQEALENNATGQGRNWINPATQRQGTVLPMRTFERSGAPCREFQQTVTIEGRTLVAYDVACRQEDGDWISEDYASLDGAINTARAHQDRRDYDPRYYRDPFRYRFGYGYGIPYIPYGLQRYHRYDYYYY